MKVELHPHIGMNMATGEQEEHDQYIVFANGKQVGYVGKAKGAPVNMSINPSESMMDEIEKEVHRFKNEKDFLAFGAPGRALDESEIKSIEEDDEDDE